MQSLDSGESDHPVTVGVAAANKPFNRFKDITVCEFNTHLSSINIYFVHIRYR